MENQKKKNIKLGIFLLALAVLLVSLGRNIFGLVQSGTEGADVVGIVRDMAAIVVIIVLYIKIVAKNKK